MAKRDRLIRIVDISKVLAYSIGMVGFASVARHLPLYAAAGFLLIYLIAAVLEYRRLRPAPRWALTAIAVFFISFTFLRVSIDNFVLPSVEAVLVLLLIKLFEEKRIRDYMQIYLLSVFLLAGAALLSLDMIFLVYSSLLAVLCSTALIFLTYHSQDPEMLLEAGIVTRIFSKALLIPLVAAPMTIVLFIVLPRTQYPFFNFLNRDIGIASTGFTDQVRLGSVSGIQEDSAVIFRANMERVDDGLLYWRGIVLDYFDGTSWKESVRASESLPRISRSGLSPVGQTIYLEPYENKYIFTLDKPIAISPHRFRPNAGLTFSLEENVAKRIKYHVWSVPGEILPERPADPGAYLQLPGTAGYGKSGKIYALVHKLSEGKTPEETVMAIRSFLKGGTYRYGLRNLPLSSRPVDDFLFKYRYGNCEYFASAMAVMLRTSGIPSRLIGGYRGGYYNEVGKYYMVLQRNAHVWVEAYIANKGWIRVDPTPMDISGFGAGRKDLFFRMKLTFDSLNYLWNASVINYDFQGQLSLLSHLHSGIKRPVFHYAGEAKRFALYLFSLMSATVAVYLLSRFVRRRINAADYVLRAFYKKAAHLGYVKPEYEGLEEFAMRIADGQKRARAMQFVKEFERHYYRDERIGRRTAKRLRDIVRSI